MDYYHWNTRITLDAAEWTGIPRSFLALRPSEPHLKDGRVARSNVWRLRRDLRDHLKEDDYSREPYGPYCPFGAMRVEDIEFELHGHLQCCHQ